MTHSSSTGTAKASFAAESACSSTCKGLPLLASLMRVAQDLWPRKTAQNLQAITGTSERMCRYWLSEKYDISADALADLLRSDDGLKFLKAVMGPARPVWWRAFEKKVNTEILSQRLRDLEAELAKLRAEQL